MTDLRDRAELPPFLAGDGEMAARINAFDWSGSLGAMADWPQSLKTTVGLLLHSPVPIVLLWGPDGIMLYNDAYSGFAGGCHPRLLGSKVREGWPEVADFNDHVMKVGLAGGTLSYKDQELTLHRSGKPEAVWMNLDYSPVIDESGKPGGVIAIVVETTARVLAQRAVVAQHDRLAQMFQDAPSFMCQMTGPEHVYTFTNAAYQQLIAHRDVIGKTVREALPEIEGQGFYDLLDRVYATGESYRGVAVPVTLQRTPGDAPEQRLLDFIYQPVRDASDRITGIFTEGYDVTESHRSITAAQSEIRRAALVELSDRIRDLDDPDELAYAAAEIMGRVLGVSRSGYGTIDPKAETITIARDWNAPGIKSLAGVLHFRDYGSYIEDLKRGETVVMADAFTDPRSAPTAAALKAISAQALVNMPVSEDGGLVALLYLNHETARDWPADEIAFIREVAQRTRTAVERRRTEAELRKSEASLRESESQFRGFAQAVPNHVWAAAPDGQLNWFNQRAYDYSGAAHGALDGVGWTRMVHPDDLEFAGARWTASLVSGAVYETEFRLRRHDGVYRWHIARAEPIRDDAGKVIRWVGTNTDIEDQKAALAALRELNAELERRVIERTQARGRTWQLSPDLMGALNSKGYFETSNPAWKSMLGWSEAEVASMSIFELLHPDDIERTRAGFQLTQEGQPAIQFPNRYRAKDGSYRWISWVGVPEDGYVYCSGRDITADKQRETELQNIRTFYTYSSEYHAMLSLRDDGAFEYEEINPATLQLYGMTREAVIGRTVEDVFEPPVAALLSENLRQALRGGQPHRYLRVQNGAAIEATATPIPADGGRRRLTVTARDVSDRLALEEQLRQAQKMEAVGQLTGGIAHDFNNLLQGITGSLDRVQYRLAEGRTQDVDRFLKAAVESANRAAALTHRLLAFSRRQTLDPKALDANKLIGGMEELIRRTIGPNVSMEVVGAGGLWPIRVDPSQLENSLLNLSINARDAMPDGGKLTIETANKWLDERAARERELAPGQYVSLSVTDSGTGMSDEVRARAFDPFFTTKPMGQGTGLGLSMIYGFVRQSGGQVRIYSEPGQGTTMCLYFPRHQGGIEEDGAARLENVERGFGETVLVVDDEATVRILVAEVLSESFYNIVEAGDGAAALKVLESDRRVDLMITDVGLPGGINGRQVADAARVLRPGLKVLFITGYVENAAIGNGHLDAGMEILAKPFAMSTLGNKVREMIES